MLHPNIITVVCTGIAMLALLIAIIVVHWSNWKKAKAAKEDALRREVQSHKFIEDERPSGQGYFHAPYIPIVKTHKVESTCPRCGGVGPVCPC
jgi:hypothetical protein